MLAQALKDLAGLSWATKNALRKAPASLQGEARQSLGAWLHDPHPELVAAALRALDPQAGFRAAALRLVRAEADPALKRDALSALGHLPEGDSQVHDLLLDSCRDDDLQDEALGVLRQLAPERARAFVREAIRSEDVGLRRFAAASLWHVDRDPVLLRELLLDPTQPSAVRESLLWDLREADSIPRELWRAVWRSMEPPERGAEYQLDRDVVWKHRPR